MLYPVALMVHENLPLSTESLQTGIAFQIVTPDLYSDTIVTTKITNVSTHYTNYLNSHFSKGMAVSPDWLSLSHKLCAEVENICLSWGGGVMVAWIGFSYERADIFLYSFTSTPSSIPPFLPPSFFLRLSAWRSTLLPEAAAARLVLLRVDVVVNLELGLVWLLCRSVLQLPDREKEKERGRGREGGMEAETGS